VNKPFGWPAAIVMEKSTPYDYSATIPAAQIIPGLLNYHILIQQGDKYLSFPGGHEGDPASWNYLNTESWQTFVAAPLGNLSLFNATTDRENGNSYFSGPGRSGGVQYISGETTGQLAFKAATSAIRKNQEMGFQLYIGNKIKDRLPEVASYGKVVIRARMQTGQKGQLRVALINKDASAYAAYISMGDQYKNIEIPLSAFKPDSNLMVPRPYPGFQSLWFKAGSFSGLSIPQFDKLEITTVDDFTADQLNKPYGIEIESVWLEN
jgi:hypothetical protein